RPPFSSEEFFAVFSAYNHAVWPAQLVLVVAALVAVGAAVWKGRAMSRWIWAFLGLLWIWTGVAYHLLHFSRVNPAAVGFGGLFLVQGAIFLWRGGVRRDLAFQVRRDAYGAAAAL